MTLVCSNNCKIKGNLEDLQKLNSDFLQSNYSMNEIIPVKDVNNEFETAEMWGTGSKMVLESAIFSQEDPSELIMCFKTNAPIEQFFRHVSAKYRVTIDYAYYNEKLEFVGIHHYERGMLKHYKYEENPKSVDYKTLILENNFSLPESKTATIISFEDLINMKRGNKNDQNTVR